jgi:peptidoglycan/xylan/chitin deacetylase (PgdA/CDA1 family)
LLLGMLSPFAAAARAATPPTVVSLTFDDSVLDQYTNALPALQSHNMHGTFYVLPGYIGINSGYMTLPDVQAVYNAGNEIAGHTVLHPFLTQVGTDEATREICQSRNTLLNWGFPVTNFAYRLPLLRLQLDGRGHCPAVRLQLRAARREPQGTVQLRRL